MKGWRRRPHAGPSPPAFQDGLPGARPSRPRRPDRAASSSLHVHDGLLNPTRVSIEHWFHERKFGERPRTPPAVASLHTVAIIEVKIHPAIGIARMGNSPTDFFIGPERRWDRSPPPGGYKDSQCRIKRQAARFRLFAYHDVGPPTEITAADGEITWTVHLANRKATLGTTHLADLTSIPEHGRSTARIRWPTSTRARSRCPPRRPPPCPWVRSAQTTTGRLLVLGGFGHSASPLNLPVNSSANNPGWYDDTSDGPVTATVTIGADTFIATAAWVAVGPPKFAPSIDNVVTLWDKLFDQFVAVGSLTAPATPSYTNDIFPILQAANDAAAVRQTAAGHHGFVHPVTNPAAAGDDLQRARRRQAGTCRRSRTSR